MFKYKYENILTGLLSSKHKVTFNGYAATKDCEKSFLNSNQPGSDNRYV